ANDVANAVGPLAAIVSAADTGEIVTTAGIPLWVMLVGALGISIGLLLFGPKLIRTVGSEITKLNPVRAFCVALAAAITVIIASALGLPVSSTHIAVGGVFGVGFLREYLARRNALRAAMRPSPLAAAEAGAAAGVKVVQAITPELNPDFDGLDEKTLKKKLKKSTKRRLVRRSHVLTIAAAWVITVPVAGVLAAVLYLLMQGMGLGA
ncbi:MAG: inorganic phosphate transporter, partial [Rhodospirillaceae bacterium]|nr:inorganic phosphate transporter [Rhodospirillaceae bacterium]